MYPCSNPYITPSFPAGHRPVGGKQESAGEGREALTKGRGLDESQGGLDEAV